MKRISPAVKTLVATALCVVILGRLAIQAIACPLCFGPSQTWAEMITEADVLLLGELISKDEGSEKTPAFSLVKVITVHKGKDLLPEEQILRIPEYIYAEEGDPVLLKARLQDANALKYSETFATTDVEARPANATKQKIQKVSATEVTDDLPLETARQVLKWDFYEKSSQAAFDYLTVAPSLDEDTGKRLRHFVNYLEHADSLIATDAWSEFANAEYNDIKSVADCFDVDKLRKWIADPKAEPERRGLYGLMLGMCGKPSDAEFLREHVGLPNSKEIRFGTEGLMGGLLTLSGAEGLEYLETTRLKNDQATGFDCFPAIKALQFAWTYEADGFEKERLRTALRPLLKREDIREIVITDLARWEDWNAVPLMADVYKDSNTANDLRTVEAVAKFLIVCRQSLAKDPDDSNAVSASELLEKIREDHLKIVKTSEDELE